MEKMTESLTPINDPALPPEITEVTCSFNGMEGSYQVFWRPQAGIKTCLLTLFRYEEPVGEAVSVTGTSGSLTRPVADDAQYYIGVAPSTNPAAYTRVPVFSAPPLKLNRIRIMDEKTVDLDYCFTGMAADQIQILISDTTQLISKTMELVPYQHEICFREYGIPVQSDYTLSLSAVNREEKTKIRFAPSDSYTLYMPAPVFSDFLTVKNGKEDGSGFTCTLTKADGFWAGGSLTACLYTGELCLFEKSGIPALSDESYEFELPAASFCAGSEDACYLKFQIEKCSVRSRFSEPVRPILWTPRHVDCRLTKEDQVQIRFYRDLHFSHRLLALGEESGQSGPFEPSLCGMYESVILSPNEADLCRFSYSHGISRGDACPPVALRTPAFYLFGDDGLFICKSDSPAYDRESAILVPLPSSLQISTGTSSAYFNISKKENGYVLELQKEVWAVSDLALRTAIRADFTAFLRILEEKGFSTAQLRAVRRLLEDYLPQSMEEFLFYHCHLNSNVLELFPGLSIKADFETYQYVGDTHAARYLNGYTGTGTGYAPVSLKNERLSMNPFLQFLSDGDYIQTVKVPSLTGDDWLCSYGGGGTADLSGPELQREYALLYYPDHFPSTEVSGLPETCKNPSVLAASTLKDLDASLTAFSQTGVPTPHTAVLYLRGRVQLTPCMPVTANGTIFQMPVGSTISDLAPVAGYCSGCQELSIRRLGLPLYSHHTKLIWDSGLFLYPGDVISWK